MPNRASALERQQGPRMLDRAPQREDLPEVRATESRITRLRGFSDLDAPIQSALQTYAGTMAELFSRNVYAQGFRHPEDRAVIAASKVDPDTVLDQEEILRQFGVGQRYISGATIIAMSTVLEDIAARNRR